ncbi:hypothetical protein YTPLAS21_19220 [Candidatus Nitrosocosmicus sp.]|nr:hypothetical protein YTPLAS21_19220 [Candidatus Nitrosocosmicus sp.]
MTQPKKPKKTKETKKRKVSDYHKLAKEAQKDLDKPVKKKVPKKHGRPTDYTPEVGKMVCDAIASHTISLYKLSQKFSWFPSEDTVRSWMWKHERFLAEYLAARQAQQILMVEECDELAQDVHYYIDEKGNKRIDSPSVAIQVARINMRKWHASKLAPKIYGDKHFLEIKGDDEDKVKKELKAIREQLEKKHKSEY